MFVGLAFVFGFVLSRKTKKRGGEVRVFLLNHIVLLMSNFSR